MPSALPQRGRFPEDSPELCVTFFTCVGTGIAGVADLQTTYPAAVLYLEAQAVRYAMRGCISHERYCKRSPFSSSAVQPAQLYPR